MDDANFPSRELLQRRSDEQLATLAQEGDKLAFEVLVRRHEKALLAYAARRLPGGRAEDAVQQSLFAAWLALQRGAVVREPRAWLYQIVHNTSAWMLRTNRGEHAPLSESLAAAETTVECAERKAALRTTLAALLRLPHQQRVALVQTSVEGRSQSEIAAELGVTDTAVRGLVYRARTGLRAAVSALSPLPLLIRLLRAGRGAAPTDQLLRPEAASSGEALVLLAKGGAVALATGVVAVGGISVHPLLGTPSAHGEIDRPASAASSSSSAAAAADRAPRPRSVSPGPGAVGSPERGRVPRSRSTGRNGPQAAVSAPAARAREGAAAGKAPEGSSAAAPAGTAPLAREAVSGGHSASSSGASTPETGPHGGATEPGDETTEAPARKEAEKEAPEGGTEHETSSKTEEAPPPPSGAGKSEERPSAPPATSEPGETGTQLPVEAPLKLGGTGD